MDRTKRRCSSKAVENGYTQGNGETGTQQAAQFFTMFKFDTGTDPVSVTFFLEIDHS